SVDRGQTRATCGYDHSAIGMCYAAPSMSEPVVRITSLSKSYGSFAAVSDVSFEVAQGEVFALLGPNGAGKTTLIRMLMDITRPESGTGEVFGKKGDGSVKARVGSLPEERGLYKRAVIGELLEYYACLKGRTRADARSLTTALLERLELAPWTKKKVTDLSKGMQQ